MDTLFWNIFEKSGDINAFLAYKDFNELKKDKGNDNKHYERYSNKRNFVW